MRLESTASDGESVNQAEASEAELHLSTIQWAIGVFCALLGALMVVAPHQFGGPIWAGVGQNIPVVGSLFLLVGLALPASVVLGVSRRLVVTAHLAVAAALLTFVYNFAVTGLLVGAAIYCGLAVGVVLSPFETRLWRREQGSVGDLFALVIGSLSMFNGLAMLLLPDQFLSPVYDPIRQYLALYGAAFLVAGGALAMAQVRSTRQTALFRATHLFILVPFLPFVVTASIPQLLWSGILFYGGFPLLAASLPWTGPHLRSIDPHSFSFRLAFALVVAAALPLIAIMGLVSGRQEQLVRMEAEAGLQASAGSIASDLAHYVGLHRSAVTALATYPGLLALPGDARRGILLSTQLAYPDVIAFSLFDASGKGVARSDDQPPVADVSQLGFFEQARRTNLPSLEARTSAGAGIPTFTFATPVRGADGSFAGVASGAIESARAATILNRVAPAPDSRVYLIDGVGHAIAHPDKSLATSLADLSSTAPVAALLTSPADRGVVSFAGPNGGVLAAYRRLPDLGWAVVVERPAGSALASLRSARNVAFGLLLLIVIVAGALGALLSKRLTHPLAALTRATRRLSIGDRTEPLPQGGSSEIRGLVTTFGAMRAQLTALLEHFQVNNEELQAQAEEIRAANEELLLASAALRENEERYRQLVELSLDAILVLRAGRVVFINSSGVKLFGAERPEEIIGRPVLDFVPPGNRQAVADHFAQISKDGRQASLREQELVRVDGSPFPAEVAAISFTFQGEPAVQVVARDVTERKKVDQLRTEYISLISHDLRSPLSGLMGHAQMLHRSLSKAGREREANSADMITKSARRMEQMIRDLVDSSGMETGRLDLRREPTDLLRLVTDVVGHTGAPEEQQRIEVQTAGDSPVVQADPQRLERALVNIITNALKYSPASRPVLIQVGQSDGQALISVMDEGVGIPPEDLPHVFERNFRARTAGQREGLGLGLYITRMIVEAHGGQVCAESELGKGSTFYVSLPLS